MNIVILGFQKLLDRNGFVVSFVLGVLLNAIFSPTFLVFLIPPIFCSLLYLCLNSPSAKQSFIVGWSFGVGHFIICFYWVFYALWMKGDSVILNIILFLIALSIYSILYGTIFGLTNLTKYYPKILSISFFTILWGVGELLRSHYIFPTPWNLIGYSLGFSDVLIQSAAIYGIYGLGVMVVFMSSLFYLKTRGAILSVFAIFLALLIFGLYNLSHYQLSYFPDTKFRIIQPNISQKDKNSGDAKKEIIKSHVELSIKDMSEDLKYIIWPENSLPYEIEDKSIWFDSLKRLVPKGGLLIFGVTEKVIKNQKVDQLFNSMFILNENGENVAKYRKYNLVPFGEYIPLKFLFPFLNTVAHSNSKYISQGEEKLIAVDSLPRFQPSICYDTAFSFYNFPENSYPKFILNITNDAWFGNSSAPYQSMTQSKIRAVEYGVALIRSANTGISAVIAPNGEVISELGLDQKGFIDSEIPMPSQSKTIYSRHGIISLFMVYLIISLPCFVMMLRSILIKPATK